MPVKKPSASKKTSSQKLATSKRTASLSIPVYSLAGVSAGRLTLPKEIFERRVNDKLLAQAARVYSFNQKIITASTKTRGEVKGTTAKIYRQKGTGRARHGAKTAPIFVGGGVVFGPKPRKMNLELPKKMKKAALLSALAAKAKDQEIVGIVGLEKASGKTKEFAKLLKKIKVQNALIVTGEKRDKVVQATNNLPKVSVCPVNQITAFAILKHQNLLIEKNALGKLGEK